MSSRAEQLAAFDRLLTVMDELRKNCPWNKKQTLQSLRHMTLEEVYELGDALLEEDWEEVKKELGDLLLHVVFYAKIGSESNDFDITAIANSICEKLISRHPHIYGTVKAADEAEIMRNWEAIKLQEGKESVLQGVPQSLPALVKAHCIQAKVSGIGFDWEHPEQVFQKVKEELNELQEEILANNPKQIEAEFGDVLFSLVNYARFLGIHPENALERTNKKFIKRFQYLENKARETGKSIKAMNLTEMETLWEEAKKI